MSLPYCIFTKIKKYYRTLSCKYSADFFKDTVHEFGKYTYGVPEISTYGFKNKVVCGKFCSIGSKTRIILGGEHFIHRISTYSFGYAKNFPNWEDMQNDFSRGDVVIGNDVWIGTQVLITSGVTIGDGSCDWMWNCCYERYSSLCCRCW